MILSDTGINVSLDTIVYYSIEIKSFIQGLIARVSSSVKAQTTAAAAPVLGRWGIQYDKRIIDRKIVQANEDHCGCCVDVRAENPKKETAKKMFACRGDGLVPFFCTVTPLWR